MKFSEEALFILALCEYVAQGKSLIKEGVLCRDNFCKLYREKDFETFKYECKKKYIGDKDFSIFIDGIKKSLIEGSINFGDISKKKVREYDALKLLGWAADGAVCVFDEDFPPIYKTVGNAQRPFLLFYKGDITLIKNLKSNVAVIGLVDPNEEIVERESTIVKKLVEQNMNIVSGLANGCDTIAHEVCINNNGKTIAVLPSTLDSIYPAKNRALAENIVNRGGLLVTEYYRKHLTKFEYVNRLIDRNRLQPMFSKAIVLSASYDKGKGDSGSRHAMEWAKKYGIMRGMIYNENKDKNNDRFGLNKKYYLEPNEDVKVMTQSILDNFIKFTPTNYSISGPSKEYQIHIPLE